MTWKHTEHHHFKHFSEISLDSEKAGRELESLIANSEHFDDDIVHAEMNIAAETTQKNAIPSKQYKG